MEIKFVVEGMMCEGCERRIENAIKTLENVETVRADHKEGIVVIHLNGNIEKSEIKEKIEKLGFQVKEG